MIINLLFLTAIFICNFFLAGLIKITYREFFAKYSWLKYVLIIPPFALSLAILLLIREFILGISNMLSDYFKY
jgi:hypothetical protein